MIFMTLEFGAEKQQREEKRRLAIASGFSVVLHLLVLACLLKPSASKSEERIEIRLLPDIKASALNPVVPQPPIPQTQFVTPSKNVEPPKVDTPFRSEHDSSAVKQTIKRGDTEQQVAKLSPPVKEKAAQEEQKEIKEIKATPKHSEPKPDAPSPKRGPATLRLSEKELVENALNDSGKKVESSDSSEKAPDSTRAQKFSQREPFRHSMNASLFKGVSGSSDYLPDIPDGDITLLNAKADRFAVFVRRVSLQVFGALRQMNWQSLSHAELARLQDFTTIEAVMDKNGKLLKVSLQDSSGSSNFDQVSTHAAEKGAWDQNPPAEAVAADGNIHFVFKSRSWSRMSPNGPGEQRWLLLGTGLL